MMKQEMISNREQAIKELAEQIFSEKFSSEKIASDNYLKAVCVDSYDFEFDDITSDDEEKNHS